jgi:cell division protein FtsZ
LEEELSIKNPMLLVGIGGAGSKIATAASAALECKCLLISNDKKDLVYNDRCTGIFVGCGEWVNPSSYKLRSFVQAHQAEIAAAMSGYSTVILIFNAGTALRRVREVSDSTIVMDNDAFLDNNPELSQQECFTITNSAIIEVICSISDGMIRPEMNVLCTSRASRSSESSLRDSLAMLYDAVPDTSTVKRAMIYVMGAERMPVGELNKMVGYIQRIFQEDGAIEVGMIPSTSSSNGVRVHLVASAPQKTRFDRYDPLGDIIPDVLDWDEPDSAPDIKLAIPTIPSIE